MCGYSIDNILNTANIGAAWDQLSVELAGISVINIKIVSRI